jgi:hypothetical protein
MECVAQQQFYIPKFSKKNTSLILSFLFRILFVISLYPKQSQKSIPKFGKKVSQSLKYKCFLFYTYETKISTHHYFRIFGANALI